MLFLYICGNAFPFSPLHLFASPSAARIFGGFALPAQLLTLLSFARPYRTRYLAFW
jgi:hypothetical protein